MTGKFLLRSDSKPNKFGEIKVILQYSTQGVPVKKSTGIFVHPDHWMGDDGRSTTFVKTGKNGHPKGDMINRRLLQMKREIDSIIDSLMVDSRCVMTVPMLRSILNGTYKEEIEEGKGRVGFVEHVLHYNEGLYKLEKIGYSVWKNIQCNMNNFRKFLQTVKGRDLDKSTTMFCRDVTVDLIKEYIMWRKNRGNSNDTINKSLTPIFKTLGQITRKGWISRDLCEEICELYLPTQSQSLENPKDDEKNHLTKNQVKDFLKIIEGCKYPKTKELSDLFMFSIHAGGMRFSDVCTLRWDEIDLENRTIHHPQVKNHTKKLKWIDLSITDECLKILMRWKGRNDNFVFGQLPDLFDLDDEEELNKTINSRNRSVNTSLQCIGEKMGLPFKLHFHCARHTFGVLALNSGVNIKEISGIMNHSSVTTTEKVYAKYLPETIKVIMDEKLNFSFEEEEEPVKEIVENGDS